jgi:oligosaccharide repeat unit polymerase
MYEQLSSLVLFFAVVGLTVNEKKRLNNLYTPFTVTAWPFVIITLLVNFVIHSIGFPMISVRANYFILLNLILIWLVGFVIFYFNDKKINTGSYSTEFFEFHRYKYFFLILAWIIMVITYQRASLLIASKGGWWYIGTDEFGREILRGLAAHFIMLGKVCFIFLAAIYLKAKKSILYYLSLLVLAACIFIAQNKYHLMMVLLMVFFMSNIQKNVKQQVFQIIKISLFLISLFFLYIIVVAVGWQTRTFATLRIWDYFYKMFLNYLVSGPIILDNWLNFPSIKPDWTMFMPFIDLWNFLLGSPKTIFQVPLLSKGFIETLSGFHSNVGTSFGVYYMIGGISFTVFMTILISIVSYYFYFKTFKSPNPLNIFFNTLFLSLGVLSFFVQYFTLFSMYEMCFSYIFIVLVLRTINKYKNFHPSYT